MDQPRTVANPARGQLNGETSFLPVLVRAGEFGQPGMVANPAHGQLNREKCFSAVSLFPVLVRA